MLKYLLNKVVKLIVSILIISILLSTIIYTIFISINLYKKKYLNIDDYFSLYIFESFTHSLTIIFIISIVDLIIFSIVIKYINHKTCYFIGSIIAGLIVYLLYASTVVNDFSDIYVNVEIIITTISGYFIAIPIYRFLSKSIKDFK